MRTVSSAFWLVLQQDAISITELITLQVPSKTFRWTTSDAEIVSSGQTYYPFPGMSGKGAEESTDLGIGTINFSLINSGELYDYFRAGALDVAPVTIRRVLTSSPNYGTIWVFQGKLADTTSDRQQIGGQARNLFNGVAAKFPIYTYQDHCVWRFGGTGCGFNTASITTAGSLNPSSSNALILYATAGTISSSYGPNGLTRGRITIASGVNSGQVRTIRANTGDMFALSHALPYAIDSGGASFNLYPGCRKSLDADCTSRFNNNAKFFGFPWIPKQQYGL